MEWENTPKLGYCRYTERRRKGEDGRKMIIKWGGMSRENRRRGAVKTIGETERGEEKLSRPQRGKMRMSKSRR